MTEFDDVAIIIYVVAAKLWRRANLENDTAREREGASIERLRGEEVSILRVKRRVADAKGEALASRVRRIWDAEEGLNIRV